MTRPVLSRPAPAILMAYGSFGRIRRDRASVLPHATADGAVGAAKPRARACPDLKNGGRAGDEKVVRSDQTLLGPSLNAGRKADKIAKSGLGEHLGRWPMAARLAAMTGPGVVTHIHSKPIRRPVIAPEMACTAMRTTTLAPIGGAATQTGLTAVLGQSGSLPVSMARVF